MMKLLSVLLLFAFLAGCSEAPGASIADPLQEAAPPAKPRVKEWDGTLTGAGKILPDGSVKFYGQFTTPEKFTVLAGDSNLTVTMTWDHAVAQPFFIHLLNEETNYRVQSTAPFDGNVGITYQVDAPLPGSWAAVGLVDGAAVNANYHIRVVIN